MGKPRLRIVDDVRSAPATVSLRLRDMFPLLLQAHRHQYGWLKDMADDEIVVTADLAEILAAFSEVLSRRKGA